jgi:hypothetical protein
MVLTHRLPTRAPDIEGVSQKGISPRVGVVVRRHPGTGKLSIALGMTRNTLCNVDETSSKVLCNNDVSEPRIPAVTRRPLDYPATVSSVGEGPLSPRVNFSF